MVYQYHHSARAQFEQQLSVTRDHIIPFIEQWRSIGSETRVLEIGCGEGGVLKAFLERGSHGTGVELDPLRYEGAKQFLQNDIRRKRARLLREDIYAADIVQELGEPFDVIILKDVIEHLPQQTRLLRRLGGLLKDGGAVFVSFPPWQMPFGGHQQVCNSRVLSRTPYFHLLPHFLYEAILRMFNEPAGRIEELLELKKTGISLERFRAITKQTGYETIGQRLYLVNPIYRYKFGLQPRRQFRAIAALPYLRDFVTTCGYFLLRPTPP